MQIWIKKPYSSRFCEGEFKIPCSTCMIQYFSSTYTSHNPAILYMWTCRFEVAVFASGDLELLNRSRWTLAPIAVPPLDFLWNPFIVQRNRIVRRMAQERARSAEFNVDYYRSSFWILLLLSSFFVADFSITFSKCPRPWLLSYPSHDIVRNTTSMSLTNWRNRSILAHHMLAGTRLRKRFAKWFWNISTLGEMSFHLLIHLAVLLCPKPSRGLRSNIGRNKAWKARSFD